MGRRPHRGRAPTADAPARTRRPSPDGSPTLIRMQRTRFVPVGSPSGWRRSTPLPVDDGGHRLGMNRFPQGVPGCPSCPRRSPITGRTTRSSDPSACGGQVRVQRRAGQPTDPHLADQLGDIDEDPADAAAQPHPQHPPPTRRRRTHPMARTAADRPHSPVGTQYPPTNNPYRRCVHDSSPGRAPPAPRRRCRRHPARRTTPLHPGGHRRPDLPAIRPHRRRCRPLIQCLTAPLPVEELKRCEVLPPLKSLGRHVRHSVRGRSDHAVLPVRSAAVRRSAGSPRRRGVRRRPAHR